MSTATNSRTEHYPFFDMLSRLLLLDVQMLGRESRLEAYTQFIQSEQAKKDKQNKDLTDLISVDPTTEIGTLDSSFVFMELVVRVCI